MEEVPSRLHIVRPGDIVEILPIPADLVATVRGAPEAILGKQVLVCEGKTEVGVCRAYDEFLISQECDSFACRGVVPAFGGGRNAVKVAKDLVGLGYKVFYLGDSDTPDINIKKAEMEKLGILVQIWKDNLAIEERAFNDLPWVGVLEALKIAVDDRGEEVIRDSVSARLGKEPSGLGDICGWAESPELRLSIGLTAKKQGWYKRIDLGEAFGRVMIKHLAEMATKDMEDKLESIKAWSGI